MTWPGKRQARVALAALGLLLAGAPVASPAQQPWPLWRAYKQSFIDGQGRVIDHSAHDRATSEGQSYALFFALVDNDRETFDKLLTWTTVNMAHGDLTLRLPAWLWGQASTGEWRVLDQNSASDADLWIAYTLLEAGKLWHEPRYAKLGRLLAARIAHDEVVEIRGFGMALLPGSRGFQVNSDSYLLNPSYLPPQLITALDEELPQGPWGALLASMPKLLGPQGGNGFAMDWLLAGPSAGAAGLRASGPPAAGSAGHQEHDAAGSYDAIRVYLWLGIADPETPGLKALLAQMSGMAQYMRTGITPPLAVDPQGRVVRTDAPVGFSAAVMPYLLALGMKDQAEAQDDRMEVAKEPGGLYGTQKDYYDQNLALFSTGWSEKRYRFERDGRLRLKWK